MEGGRQHLVEDAVVEAVPVGGDLHGWRFGPANAWSKKRRAALESGEVRGSRR
jgi:hypothetical protein